MTYSYDRRAAVSPFVGLSPELRDSLNRFAGSLAFWMGLPTLGNIQAIARVWRGNKELKTWLGRNVNLPSYQLFFGRRLEKGDPLPEMGSELPRKGTLLQWSSDRKVAEWFAGIGGSGTSWAGGALAQASASGKQVVVDVDRFSMVCGRYHADFAALMTRSDPIQMFNGEAYEGEVLTTASVRGTVVEAEWF